MQLTRTARAVGQAFDRQLGDAGGSLPIWLVLLNTKIRQRASQRELAAAVGITEATLTHHLNAMEADGLLTRRRHETNRRVHVVELTDAGEEAFVRLRDVAGRFDRGLRRNFDAEDLARLHELLGRLAANVGAHGEMPGRWDR